MKFIRINDRVINKDHITSITFKQIDNQFPDSSGPDGLLIAIIWYTEASVETWIEYKVRIECFIRWDVHTSSYYLDEFTGHVCDILNNDRISGIKDCVEKPKD